MQRVKRILDSRKFVATLSTNATRSRPFIATLVTQDKDRSTVPRQSGKEGLEERGGEPVGGIGNQGFKDGQSGGGGDGSSSKDTAGVVRGG